MSQISWSSFSETWNLTALLFLSWYVCVTIFGQEGGASLTWQRTHDTYPPPALQTQRQEPMVVSPASSIVECDFHWQAGEKLRTPESSEFKKQLDTLESHFYQLQTQWEKVKLKANRYMNMHSIFNICVCMWEKNIYEKTGCYSNLGTKNERNLITLWPWLTSNVTYHSVTMNQNVFVTMTIMLHMNKTWNRPSVHYSNVFKSSDCSHSILLYSLWETPVSKWHLGPQRK